MTANRTLLAVTRLIAIKREELERHRLDFLRLQRMVETELTKLIELTRIEYSFIEEMRLAESNSGGLDATSMIQSRQYLQQLQARCSTQKQRHGEVEMQEKLAQSEMERALSEARTLERLAERRQSRRALEAKRLDYVRADDLEITRSANARGAHVIH